MDIGYRFLPSSWGKGYATESAQAIMAHGRGVLGLNRIIGLVAPNNATSARVLRKLGLAFERRIALVGLDQGVDLYA